MQEKLNVVSRHSVEYIPAGGSKLECYKPTCVATHNTVGSTFVLRTQSTNSITARYLAPTPRCRPLVTGMCDDPTDPSFQQLAQHGGSQSGSAQLFNLPRSIPSKFPVAEELRP